MARLSGLDDRIHGESIDWEEAPENLGGANEKLPPSLGGGEGLVQEGVGTSGEAGLGVLSAAFERRGCCPERWPGRRLLCWESQGDGWEGGSRARQGAKGQALS